MGIFKYIRSKNHFNRNREYFTLVLNAHSQYFRDLNQDKKTLFLQRLAVFMIYTKFSSEKGFKILPDMKILISSAFIQITFGLKEFTLKQYNKIFIAPRSYSYAFDPRLFSGDVNASLKRVSLSWPCVLKGFEIPTDAINIAIHEFGHCLALENLSRSFFGRFFDKQAWDLWIAEGTKGDKILRSNSCHTEVSFEGRSMMEMFAVTLETFFERPDDLAENLPDLYNVIKRLLNQEPRNKDNPTAVVVN